MSKKIDIESAKYSIESITVEKHLVHIVTQEATLLSNIFKACIMSANTDGAPLGIQAEAKDNVLKVSGNVENTLHLLRDKQLISAGDMNSVLTNDEVIRFIDESKPTDESSQTPNTI